MQRLKLGSPLSAPGSPTGGRARVRLLLLLLLALTVVFAHRMRDPRYWSDLLSLVDRPLEPSKARVEPAHRNALRLGADSPIEGAYEVPLGQPADLNFRTRAEILRIREQAVRRHPGLVRGGYRPDASVFGQIVSGRPWWGLVGQTLYGAGQHSIEGPAEESRFLANPFLLLAADLWVPGPEMWNRAAFTEADLKDRRFPLDCVADRLVWWPREARAEATYDLTVYARTVSRYTKRPFSPAGAMFDLIAYNARDFDLNFLYLPLARSENVRQPSHAASPFPIRHFIHLGGSCRYPGGCNNMSPADPNTDALEITAVPARVEVLLWRRAPLSPAVPADMTFTLRLN